MAQFFRELSGFKCPSSGRVSFQFRSLTLSEAICGNSEWFSSSIACVNYWWLPILLDVSRPEQAPARRNSRAVRGADEDVVVQIPDRCLTAAGTVKQIVRMAVAVKVGCCH